MVLIIHKLYLAFSLYFDVINTKPIRTKNRFELSLDQSIEVCYWSFLLHWIEECHQFQSKRNVNCLSKHAKTFKSLRSHKYGECLPWTMWRCVTNSLYCHMMQWRVKVIFDFYIKISWFQRSHINLVCFVALSNSKSQSNCTLIFLFIPHVVATSERLKITFIYDQANIFIVTEWRLSLNRAKFARMNQSNAYFSSSLKQITWKLSSAVANCRRS